MSGNDKKSEQLGIPFGTASNKLRKNVLFSVIARHGENVCFQCNGVISSPDELSIEHKIPWLGKNNELFWDIANIAFSHLSCNVSAGSTGPLRRKWLTPQERSKANNARRNADPEMLLHDNRVRREHYASGLNPNRRTH